MGWASGSGLFSAVIDVIQENISDPNKRFYVYQDLIQAFEESDWDTQDECVGKDPEYDRALKQIHPDWYEQEDEVN